MRTELIAENILFRELKYPHTYDKRTTILNHILNGIVRNIKEKILNLF